MIFGHVIALDPRPAQAVCFRRACGAKRFAHDCRLAERQRMREAGEKPNTEKVKQRWNAYRKVELPWSYEVTKCAGGQAIMDLGAAFSNFFRDCNNPRKQRHFHYPSFKNKRFNESFAPWIRMREEPRFE
jgi:putative transposase